MVFLQYALRLVKPVFSLLFRLTIENGAFVPEDRPRGKLGEN